ncbi:chaperone clpB, putative, partial [Entamoeba invadens IP1]
TALFCSMKSKKGAPANGRGRTVDFKNTVIIMTSNLGSDILLNGTTKDGNLKSGVKEAVLDNVKKFFKPEFINRLDDIVVFTPLRQEELRKIVKMQMKDIVARIKKSYPTCDVELTEKAVDQIITVGFSPQYGARPMRRYLEKKIVTDISVAIIKGDLKENKKIVVGAKDDEITVTIQ